MQITADVSKFSKTVQRDLTSILNVFQNLAFILYSFQQFWLKIILVVSHEIVFIENEAVTIRNYVGTYKIICSYNLVNNFLIQLLPLQNSVFAVHFSNEFWHGNMTFPEGSSQNKIIPLLVIFYLPIVNTGVSKYVFTRVVIKIKIFHQCRTRAVRVALVLHSCRSFSTRVELVPLVSSTRVVNQTRSYFFVIPVSQRT